MRTRLILCIAALLFTELAGGFFHHSIVPPRRETRDWGVILPLLLCIGVGVTVRDPIRRAVFGLAQGLVFLDVYSNWFRRDLAFETDPEYHALLAKLLAAIATYAIAFTLLTTLLRRLLIRTRPPDNHCRQCGYNLRGLVEPRCPECGQPFAENAVPATDEAPSVDRDS